MFFVFKTAVNGCVDMKKLVFVLLFVLSLNADTVSKNLEYLRNDMTFNQKYIMFKVFNMSKKYDLQYTMTAISWQESKFGKWKINLRDPSCGYFHKLLPEYAKELGLKPNNWNMSRACEKLQDFDISFEVAIETFKRKEKWCRRHLHTENKGIIWKCAVKRYNGSGIRADNYYNKIVKKIKALRIYMSNNGRENGY